MKTLTTLAAVGLWAIVWAAPPADAPSGRTLPPAQAPQAAPLPNCTELAAALRSVANNDARLRDWPNLARYRDANRTAPHGTVVFMGDSITDSWQQPRFGGFFPGRNYVDRGISGQTTPQMVLRFRADVLDLEPRAVLILAGTNDIAGNTGPMTNEEIEGYLTTMSELASANGVKVILASILPVGEYHTRPNGVPQTTARPMDRIRALNEWIRAYASAHGHVYLDYFAAMTDAAGLLEADLSADDLHPTAQGYAVMAPLAETAIAKALR
jgi:lysophospholipase L1-like esterase